ncbi:MAG: T9SS type A sorting domain-containing protein, partial [Bacteroidetes bacterium]|nr:T9SS type A sorting domain-containing protein [Bacteroidota bacterium]
RDGYRLVRVWWEGNSFQSQVLDEFDKDISDGQGRYNVGTLLSQPNGKFYWLGASSGANLTVYNLSNDKLEKSNTQKYNGGVIGTLHHSIDNNASLDFYIWTLNATVSETCEIAFYSGDIEKGLSEISHFTTVQMASLISTGDVTGNGKADIALSNDYFPSFEKYRFSILSLKDTVTSVQENQVDGAVLSIKAISPMPVSKDKVVQIKVSVPQASNYTLSLFDRVGKKIMGKTEQYQLTGEQTLSINIEDYRVNSGVYTLQLEGKGKIAQCSILIEE